MLYLLIDGGQYCHIKKIVVYFFSSQRSLCWQLLCLQIVYKLSCHRTLRILAENVSNFAHLDSMVRGCEKYDAVDVDLDSSDKIM